METNNQRCKVVRIFHKSGRRRIIYKNVSREFAEAHCSNPRTSKRGVFMDVFYVI